MKKKLALPASALPFIRAQRSSCHTIDEYFATVEQEFAVIKPHLPNVCNAWADIGCGIGGLSAMLGMHYPNATALLIDREEVSRVLRYGYRTAFEYYNSLDIAATLVGSTCTVRTQHANRTIAATDASLDIILSTLSWCFHYPYVAYRREALRTLRPGSILIVDIREGVDHSPLFEDFKLLHTIESSTKYRRVICGA